jgi:prepilin-type N-terminal cleavage/methylation domain-containing protein/prepilin-type processing-associated H-X9-DG protein
MSRRRGFTLIELLVVIAIIAALAAMLFPVFARARESARKIQCLSNVKNIAMAFQMYLADYDKFNPSEHRQEVLNYFHSKKSCCCKNRIAMANPYLKVPVILDEYIKNRDVWRCPSATVNTANVTINSGLVNNEHVTDWFREMVDSTSKCPTVRSCCQPFPPGWGGTVTDTIAQGACAILPLSGQPGAFAQSVGTGGDQYDLSTSQISDPARWFVAGDSGQSLLGRTSNLAYPEMCFLDGNACSSTCGGDWINCPVSRSCSPLKRSEGGTGAGALDPQWRKDHAHPRHLGGSNVGFADGHAKWMSSEAILFGGGENRSGYANGTDLILNLPVCIVPAYTNQYR